MSSGLVSLCVTSYNRPLLIKNCIESFFKTSTYDSNNIELIVVDNGSTDDRVLNYLNSLQPNCADYKLILNEKNDYPICTKYAKVQARRIAQGDYFIDSPDDHLFVVEDDWISRSISHINSHNNVGCVIHYAYPFYRFRKQNNAMNPHENNLEIYESLHKGYADYHIMAKETYRELGEFKYELEAGYPLGKPGAESEYMKRAHAQGYRRNMLKYPVAIINEEKYVLNKPLQKQDMVEAFETLDRPASNEEMLVWCMQKDSITKSITI